jgi:hypothetical protein
METSKDSSSRTLARARSSAQAVLELSVFPWVLQCLVFPGVDNEKLRGVSGFCPLSPAGHATVSLRPITAMLSLRLPCR